uniref:Uncharacterized protein n=1 Tax=Pygocentrus nattereri TaxID=42514 RepID=A0A3B4D0Y8_PYGNA
MADRCIIISIRKILIIFSPSCFGIKFRFRGGLQSLGVLDALQKYPERFKEVFMKTAIPLTASAVEVLFKCKLAERGSNRFESQCLDIEAITLEEIIVFTTGCDSIPPLGFSPLPSLEFEIQRPILATTSSGYPLKLHLMVWGGISLEGRTALHVLARGSLTAIRY